MSIKDRDAIPKEQEQKDIRAIREYVHQNAPVALSDICDASPGPTTDDELSMVGLTREKQIRLVLDGLDYADEVTHHTDEYIVSDGME
jgi:hypothetical protein